MLLQAFDGAIVAITHNKAFADNLRATHVLRVQVCSLSKLYLFLGCITAFVPSAQSPCCRCYPSHSFCIGSLVFVVKVIRFTGVNDCSARPSA